MAQASSKSKSSTGEPIAIAIKMRHRLREAGLIVVGSLSLFLLLALLSFHPADPGWSHTGVVRVIHNLGGKSGAWIADVMLYLFGMMAYLLPILVAYLSWWIYQERREAGEPPHLIATLLKSSGLLLLIGCGSGLAHIHLLAQAGLLPDSAYAGGILGHVMAAKLLVPLFGNLGATLFQLALFLTGITLLTGLSWIWLMDATGAKTLQLIDWLQRQLARIYGQFRAWIAAVRARRAAVAQAGAVQEVPTEAVPTIKRPPPRIEPMIHREQQVEIKVAADRPEPQFEPRMELDAGLDTSLPSLSLLDPPPTTRVQIPTETLEAISRLVELKLKDFNIEVVVESVHPGPVITRYEIQPAPGVKVSQIVNLSKDLARSLSTTSVRVVEVIPGKTTIGLEIPNDNREIVYLSETLSSKAYAESKSPLTMALGKDIGGTPMVADLAKMPHLLVAGTTGSGKSVAINTMILSLLYNATPKEVRLIMVDPKMLELSVYDGIPHLLAPVVTDMKDAANALRWCVAEMERRYKLMAALGVRNVGGYNKKVEEAIANNSPISDPLFQPDPLGMGAQQPADLDTMPFIVVIIDELADMMMVVGKKVEELIARLAQKARAAGIHLILATQRPSVDVLTGLIKANIPTRIAFQVSSKIDSRTVLDQMGAEALLGHGDMLYLPPGRAVPERVHGAFVDDHEVHKVVNDLKRRGEPNYDENIVKGMDDAEGAAFGGEAGGGGGSESDELYDQAVEIVTDSRRASVSGIQRRLKIGYNRAARMVEDMESAGVVGPIQSNGSREVLAPPPVRD